MCIKNHILISGCNLFLEGEISMFVSACLTHEKSVKEVQVKTMESV